MLVLDTDHLVEFQKGTSAEAHRLKERLVRQAQPFGTTIVSVEEIMRGWMAAIRRVQDPHVQVNAYVKLRQLFEFFAVWNVLDWDEDAATEFRRLRAAKFRIGTMDLKIASITISRGATLLSRNRRDFESIPGLTVENWLA